MQSISVTRPARSALALGAALCLASTGAFAKSDPNAAVATFLTKGSGLELTSKSSFASPNAGTQIYTFDVTGIFSNDAFGAAINEVYFLDIGPLSTVVGLGWDVTLFADDPSWLSEMAVTFGSTDEPFELRLRPGVGSNTSGTASFSSNGILDLVSGGFEFTVGTDGQLRMEFSETFVDFPGDWDGEWLSGTLTFEVSPIPEPSTYGLMALGLLGVAAAARRRKA